MIKVSAIACLLTFGSGSIALAAAPVPEAAHGVYVEEISSGLYWITDAHRPGSVTNFFAQSTR